MVLPLLNYNWYTMRMKRALLKDGGMSQQLSITGQAILLQMSSLINVREYQGAVKKGQSRKTCNKGYIRRRKTKQKHNTIFVASHCC